jgi:hypothetical protein
MSLIAIQESSVQGVPAYRAPAVFKESLMSLDMLPETALSSGVYCIQFGSEALQFRNQLGFGFALIPHGWSLSPG